MEIHILDMIQNLRTPIGDVVVPLITRLGDAGIIWIILTVLLLIIPKTRKTGVIMMAALLADVLLCNVVIKNLVARTRPFDVNTAVQLLVAKPRDYSFPSGHTAASFASVTALYLAGEKKESGSCTCGSDRIIKIVPVCALSNGHHRWCGIRKPFWISGL